MTEYDKAKATAEKIKADVAKSKEIQEQPKDLTEAKTKVQNQLQAISNDQALVDMYKSNAEVGGSLPLLKVHTLGKSTKNELADGSQPKDGWFFYKPTGEQFETLTCHILTISRGYVTPDMNNKDKFNQILAGVIVDEKGLKPFLMYMTGTKLSNMWDFGKDARKYTKAKPFPIPMFALTVNLTTETKATQFGKSWIINFEIEKNEDNSPVLITDPGLFQALKDMVGEVKETIENLINKKSSEEEATTIKAEPVDINQENTDPDNSNGNIPF